MKIPQPLFTIGLAMLCSYAQAQTKITVVQDSVRITSGELVIRNATKNVTGYLYNKGNGVTEFRAATSGNTTIQTLTDGTSVTWDVSSTPNGQLTLAGTGRTLAISNPVQGMRYILKVNQDAIGGRTITTWPSNIKWAGGGTAPTLTAAASSIDLITLFYDGTSFLASAHLDYKGTGGGSPPPASLTVVSTNNGWSNNGAIVHSLTSVPAGALIVVSTTQDGDGINASVTASGLSFTKKVDIPGIPAGGTGDGVEIWTAPVTTAGNYSVSTNWNGVNSQFSSCTVLTGQETTLAGATNTALGQSAPNISLTTTKANSLIFGAIVDFNNVDGSSRVFRDGATEKYYYRDPCCVTSYFFIKQATMIGSYSEGLSSPTGQDSNTAVLEIRTN